jgi:trehalose-6-phosphate synthase
VAHDTAETLRNLIRNRVRGHKFITVSNREPYMHVWREGSLGWIRPASGLVVALDPVMRSSRGLCRGERRTRLRRRAAG